MNSYKSKKLLRKIIKVNNFISKKPFIKKNLHGLVKTAGRNNSGRITIRHKGSGNKNNYRKLDFSRSKIFTGIVCSIEYDPNRNANIAAIYNYFNNSFFYVIAAKNLKIGDIVKSNSFTDPKLGHSLPINKIPVGSFIHNLKLKNSKFGNISRSAGTFSQIKEKTLHNALIKLSSGKLKLVSSKNQATIGAVSNEFAFLFQQLNKAGQSRWLNKRPKVRGVAMNPVDHPNGGGEGKKSSKKSPWGKIKNNGAIWFFNNISFAIFFVINTNFLLLYFYNTNDS